MAGVQDFLMDIVEILGILLRELVVEQPFSAAVVRCLDFIGLAVTRRHFSQRFELLTDRAYPVIRGRRRCR